MLKNPSFENLSKFAINYSDAVIQGSENINNKVLQFMKDSNLPIMNFPGKKIMKINTIISLNL